MTTCVHLIHVFGNGIGADNLLKNEFKYCFRFLKSDVAYLVANQYDMILKTNLVENFKVTRRPNIIFNSFRQPSPATIPFLFQNFLLVKRFE